MMAEQNQGFYVTANGSQYPGIDPSRDHHGSSLNDPLPPRGTYSPEYSSPSGRLDAAPGSANISEYRGNQSGNSTRYPPAPVASSVTVPPKIHNLSRSHSGASSKRRLLEKSSTDMVSPDAVSTYSPSARQTPLPVSDVEPSRSLPPEPLPAGAGWDRIYVTSLAGKKLLLKEICGDQRTALVFLRRFECTSCTSYFILFAHLRPILRQSNIRTVFITCHEDLTEVQAFIKSFAFWLRTLQPDTDDRGNNPGILPGEIYLDTHRYSYAHFGIHTNVTWLEIARDLARNTYLNWMGKSHLNQPNAPAMEGYNYETQARLVLWNEIGATFKRGFFSKVRTGTQSPGIVIVERGQVLYKHVVKDQYRPVPQNTAELSEALLCSYDSVQGIDSVVEEGLRRFMESLQHRDTAGNVPKSELVVRSVLGKGLESEVYKCDWRGMAVAVKSYTVAAEDSEAAFNITMTSFSTEAALLMSLRHPNVLQLMGFGCEPPFRPFLVSEFMPRGSLFDVLANRSIELTPELKKSMLMDAAKGMQFLHKSGVIHQDLKSLNLLVDEDFTCKVADFGIAKVTGRGKRRRVVKEVLEAARRRRGSGNNPNDPVGSVTGQPAGGPSSGHAAGAGAGGNSGGFRSTNTSGSDRLQDSANDSDVKAHRGTIHWMPPEVMVPVPPPPTTKADVFAFGVIGWEVATRGQPWPGVAPADVCEAVVAGYRMPYPDPRNTAEQKYWRLVVDCWDQDPKKRPEFSKIVSRLSWLTIPG